MAAQRRDTPRPAPPRGHDRGRAPTLVVCAAFDPAADAAMEQLRDRVAAVGHRVRRAHRPHFTLTAAGGADPADVAGVVAEVAARHGPIQLAMAALGSFPSGVLFVAPGDCPALRVLQRDAYDTLRRRWPPAFGRQSAPDDWTAHCTLATRLPPPDLRALRASAFEPFPATVDTLTVIAVGGSGDLARCRLG